MTSPRRNCVAPWRLYATTQLLLLRRPDIGDWVLPGGRPRHTKAWDRARGGKFAKRPAWMCTRVGVRWCWKFTDPVSRHRIVELVFVADEFDISTPVAGEPGTEPVWVAWMNSRD